jgi:glycosyltransferase involved in cell wall biosynthesis
MKIIFASKFYYRRGGLESYLFKAKELLELNGHTVIPFSTNFSENYQTEYSKFFCTYYNLSKESISKRPTINSMKAIANMFFNREAYKNMKDLIAFTKPDIVQGFGVTKHLSYSIFKAAKDSGVKTVMRLSDYALLCPNSVAMDGLGQICRDFSCSGNDFTSILKRRCVHESFVASLIGNFEIKINLFFETYKRYVDYFIAPSRFMKEVFVKFSGISPERIVYIPIFAAPVNTSLNDTDENYFLYGGRLSHEKGVFTLLRAMKEDERLKLIIAGNGPLENEYKKYVQDNKLNAELVGFKNLDELHELIKKCRALVIPSEWYENSPNIILEAYSQGKPVIGSRIGGIPELIDENKTGLLFEAGNCRELARCMRTLYDDRRMAQEMGNRGNELVKTKFGQEEHYEELTKFYDSVLKKKVLLVNNFYYNRGGDCTYLFSLKDLLERKGQKTVVFSMHHPQNYRSEWSKYFVDYINYDEEVKKISLLSIIKVASRTIFFYQANRRINKIIREEKPDIAHLQNIHHHITPSILFSLNKYGIPVVWTLHDYQLICPNISFLANGKVCEKCKSNQHFWPAIVRCKKGSFSASLMSAIEAMVHNLLNVVSYVDIFIAPSKFLMEKFIEYKFNPERLRLVHYFMDLSNIEPDNHAGDYFLYVGRLSEEKGIATLIDATINLFYKQGLDFNKSKIKKLKIVGGGPMKDRLELHAKSNDKNGIIEFLGHKSRDEVLTLLKNCRFSVVPSEWYENYPYSILETFACYKPVIGSRVGGIIELIKDNETGLTFEMGNVDDLSSKIEYMVNNPDEIERMGKNARVFVESELNSEKHYEKLMEIYANAIRKNRNVVS